MIEVNCETDFVTRNEDFQSFVEELLQDSINHVCDTMAMAVSERMEEKMAQIGEKISLRRNVKWVVNGTGAIGSYIHMGGTVGVLIELSCDKNETISNQIFKDLLKDLTLHVQPQIQNFYLVMMFHLIKLNLKKIFLEKNL